MLKRTVYRCALAVLLLFATTAKGDPPTTQSVFNRITAETTRKNQLRSALHAKLLGHLFFGVPKFPEDDIIIVAAGNSLAAAAAGISGAGEELVVNMDVTEADDILDDVEQVLDDAQNRLFPGGQ